MSNSTPAAYWRQTSDWAPWLGQTGTVIAQTLVHVSSPELAALTPYAYVIVEFGQQRIECVGADHQPLAVGDRVQCVLRRAAIPSPSGLIPYRIKVVKVGNR